MARSVHRALRYSCATHPLFPDATMLIRTALASITCLGVALAVANATPLPHPGARIINVHDALARKALHNTPANEDGAASWRPLPRVTFLRSPERPLDPIRLLPGVKPLLDGLEAFPH
jgi:hypothetical protein